MVRESKIVELLKSFSHNEYKKFGDFVKSPFHNKSDGLIKLYDYFGKFSKDFSGLFIEYEEIADFVLPDEKFNESRVRSLISNLVKLIEQFLIYTTFEKYTTYQKILLINTLNLRNLTKSFKTTLSETLEDQKKQYNRDEDFYYNQIYLEVESFNYHLDRSIRVNVEDFGKISDNINLFFILTKLNLLHFMTFQMQSDSETPGRIWLMNEIIDYIEENLSWISKEHPVIYMKYLILMTIMKPGDETYFRNLKKFVLNNLDKFRSEELNYVFGALTNYCMIRCNGGDIGFKYERFKVYKLIEDNGIHEKEKYMNFIEFLNSIISALEVNKIKWTEKFFEKYKDKIIPELKDSTVALAKAQILFHKKQYEEALEVLNTVNITNYYFYLRNKKLLVMIYYDIGKIEPILYIIDAARHYLKRNTKISKINIELFLKFFNYLGKIVNLDSNQKTKIKNIKYELIKEEKVSSKEWLLTKIEELEKIPVRFKSDS
jgi:L-rhamnose mutarotase